MRHELEIASYTNGPVGKVSWGAIIAGVFVVVATTASLGLLGAGIGAMAAPAAGSGSALAKGLGYGAAGWLAITGIGSFFAGGWVTGRLTRAGSIGESVVHSTVTWACATTAFLLLLTTAVGGALGGAANLVGSTNIVDRVESGGASSTDGLPAQGQMTTAAKTAGAAGIGGFVMMGLEAAACGLGARYGTRAFRSRSSRQGQHSSHRAHETTVA